MIDVELDSDEQEKVYVVTEILSCRRTFIEDQSIKRVDGPCAVTCSHTTHDLWPASLRSWLFGELELAKYGKKHLDPVRLPSPEVKILRLAIGIYDDDFNAYRGVYHGIGGVYLGVLNLGWHERESIRNIHPIMFIPHAAEREGIYQELENELRTLEETGMRITVRDQDYHVFVKLLVQVTDMPQGDRS